MENNNENIRKILIDAYVYRDIKENVNNLTFQIEKLFRNTVAVPPLNDFRFNNLYRNRYNIYEFYNSLTLEELQRLGF
jgi:hypothetical protein